MSKIEFTEDKLRDAIRLNDSLADQGMSSETLLPNLGLDPQAVYHLSHQRALRIVLLNRGGDWPKLLREAADRAAFTVDFTPEEERMMVMLQSVYFDAFCAVARVAQDESQ